MEQQQQKTRTPQTSTNKIGKKPPLDMSRQLKLGQSFKTNIGADDQPSGFPSGKSDGSRSNASSRAAARLNLKRARGDSAASRGQGSLATPPAHGQNSVGKQSRASRASQGASSSGSGLRLNLGNVNQQFDDSYDDEEEGEEADSFDYGDEQAALGNFNQASGAHSPASQTALSDNQPQNFGRQQQTSINSNPSSDLITQVQKGNQPQTQISSHPISISPQDFDMANSLLPPIAKDKVGKKTLVLDLDETLVRSQFTEPERYDLKLPVRMENREYEVFVAVRPGCSEFLAEMSKYYELVIFTASLSKYANPLMDILDPKRYCTGRLFREHCCYIDRVYMKDMSQVGRRIEDVILIDNSPNSYRPQPENAIPILSWYDDYADTELYKIMPLLIGLSKVPDVRTVLGVVHKDHQMNLKLAEDMVAQLLKEQQQRESSISKSRTNLSSNNNNIVRPSHLSTDFDLNDRTSDQDIINQMQQPFGQKAVNSGVDSGSQKSDNKKRSLRVINQNNSASASNLHRGNGSSKVYNQPVSRTSSTLNEQNKRVGSNSVSKLTQSNADQKLNTTDMVNAPSPMNDDTRLRFKQNVEMLNQQQKVSLKDISFRNQSYHQESNDQSSHIRQNQLQGGQGNQGASLGVDDSILASNRTFMNERTDLTATEVSPRIHQSEIVQQQSGQKLKINTRVIKLSQEKTSIKMLNIKGRVKNTRLNRIMQSIQMSEEDKNSRLLTDKHSSLNSNLGSPNGGQHPFVNLFKQKGHQPQLKGYNSAQRGSGSITSNLFMQQQYHTNSLSIESPSNGARDSSAKGVNQYLSAGSIMSINSPQNHYYNQRRVDAPIGGAPPNAKKGLNQHRSDARTALTIDIPDEKRCNLEDDESFEEEVKGSSRQMTAGVTRKSSINATPKSRVIEPGKIFSSRYMTPSSGARGRMGSLGIQKQGQSSKNANHKHSLSNLITSGEAVQIRTSKNVNSSYNKNTSLNQSAANAGGSGQSASNQAYGNNNKKRLNNLVSSLIKFN